ARGIQRLKIFASLSRWHGVRNVDERLRRLADGDGGDDFVLERVDRRHHVPVFDADVEARAVAGRPEAVRQVADRDPCDLREGVGAEGEDHVQAAYGDVSELAARVADDVYVVGN